MNHKIAFHWLLRLLEVDTSQTVKANRNRISRHNLRKKIRSERTVVCRYCSNLWYNCCIVLKALPPLTWQFVLLLLVTCRDCCCVIFWCKRDEEKKNAKRFLLYFSAVVVGAVVCYIIVVKSIFIIIITIIVVVL